MPYEKVGNNEPVCIADEVPFEIPESWEWVRLSHIFSVLNGDRGKNYPAKSTLSSTGIPFISALNLDGSTVVADDRLLCMTEAQYDKLGNGKLIKGDVVVCIRGSLGKHGRYPFDKGAIASSLVILRCHSCEEILAEFIMLWLDSPLFSFEIKKYDNGTAQPNLAAKSLEQFFVPLPPLNEQYRIIQQIENLQPYLDDYNGVSTKITKLNETFPELLKKSILQWAVQGKLVPQDTSDEPAEALLERIREEKQKLIKEGKIKKDKHESVIFRRDNSYYEKFGGIERCIDDELPFEIPESWEWARLGSVIELQSGQDMAPDKYNENGNGTPYITGASNIIDGTVIINRWTTCGKAFAHKGDILLTCKGTVGTMAILQEETVHIARQIMAIRSIGSFCVQYIQLVLETMIENLKAAAKSMIPGISRNDVLTSLFPVPPLNEQRRIVEKVKEALAYIDYNKSAQQ